MIQLVVGLQLRMSHDNFAFPASFQLSLFGMQFKLMEKVLKCRKVVIKEGDKGFMIKSGTESNAQWWVDFNLKRYKVSVQSQEILMHVS